MTSEVPHGPPIFWGQPICRPQVCPAGRVCLDVAAATRPSCASAVRTAREASSPSHHILRKLLLMHMRSPQCESYFLVLRKAELLHPRLTVGNFRRGRRPQWQKVPHPGLVRCVLAHEIQITLTLYKPPNLKRVQKCSLSLVCLCVLILTHLRPSLRLCVAVWESQFLQLISNTGRSPTSRKSRKTPSQANKDGLGFRV